MISDELAKHIRAVVVQALLETYRGTVVSQDPGSFALIVQVPLMPPITVAWTLGTKYAVPAGTPCAIVFDSMQQATLVAVADSLPATSPAILGDLFLAFFDTHTHPGNGAPPSILASASPVPLVSTTEKVRS